jgi:hypothetical protein
VAFDLDHEFVMVQGMLELLLALTSANYPHLPQPLGRHGPRRRDDFSAEGDNLAGHCRHPLFPPHLHHPTHTLIQR